jgi:hypothetical protein
VATASSATLAMLSSAEAAMQSVAPDRVLGD